MVFRLYETTLFRLDTSQMVMRISNTLMIIQIDKFVECRCEMVPGLIVSVLLKTCAAKCQLEPRQV